jgi:hypothetical protein
LISRSKNDLIINGEKFAGELHHQKLRRADGGLLSPKTRPANRQPNKGLPSLPTGNRRRHVFGKARHGMAPAFSRIPIRWNPAFNFTRISSTNLKPVHPQYPRSHIGNGTSLPSMMSWG